MNDTSKNRTQESRHARFIGRAALRSITTDLRCVDCGWMPRGDAVGLRLSDGVAGFAGLVSCGRIWLCPVCNAKVMARRAIEIAAALSWAEQRSFRVIWGSLTCRHNLASPLADLFDVQRSAWRYLVGRKTWRKASAVSPVEHQHTRACASGCARQSDYELTELSGRVGYIRAAEVNYGDRNGWHPHFHPLIIWRGSQTAAQRFADAVVKLWVEGVELAGGEARGYGSQQLKALGADAYWDEFAGYVTKQTYDAAALALEASWSQGKKGRGRAFETVSHWSLLAKIAQGDADSCERWFELEAAVPGHRMVSWSRGLRQLAGVGLEATDEEIAAEDLGTKEDTVCFITPDGWSRARANSGFCADLLTALENSGWAGARELLDEYSVEYFTLEPATV